MTQAQPQADMDTEDPKLEALVSVIRRLDPSVSVQATDNSLRAWLRRTNLQQLEDLFAIEHSHLRPGQPSRAERLALAQLVLEYSARLTDERFKRLIITATEFVLAEVQAQRSLIVRTINLTGGAAALGSALIELMELARENHTYEQELLALIELIDAHPDIFNTRTQELAAIVVAGRTLPPEKVLAFLQDQANPQRALDYARATCYYTRYDHPQVWEAAQRVLLLAAARATGVRP